MVRVIAISCVCAVALSAAEVQLDAIEIISKTGTVVENIKGKEIKSADLGEALSKESASVSIIRRSGVANDILIRGQKKDNITVTIDGAKVCGACPNRMDPPISHVLTNNVDYIEINEGPFNVSDFGSLSADVKVHTLKPTRETHGELALSAGSWDYLKGAFMLSGGVEKFRFLLSASSEKSGQYKDGNGDDFYGQIANAIASGHAVAGNQLQTKYKDMDAYTKKTLMGKVYYDITDNQELKASFTMNNSDNVLYPNSMMDALYDDSKIYTLGYTAKNLGSLSKKLDLDLYRSTVDHPMATKFRNAGATNYTTAHLDTVMEGAKVTNSFELGNHTITGGVDLSNRNWDGRKYSTNVSTGAITPMGLMIDDVDTKNRAIFLKDKIALSDKLILEAGARYDDTTIDKHGVEQRDFSDFSGYLFSKYEIADSTDLFGGLGRSTRVPDAKELYLIGSGTATLNAVTNNEIDFGVEKRFDKSSIKAKAFYSKYDNYIAYNKTSAKYENVDATVYGFDIGGSYAFNDNLSIDASTAYQVGTKDKPLAGQNETNMPDIAPWRANIGVNYEVTNNFKIEADMLASAPWENFDAANGEQKLDSYFAFNLKGTKILGDGLELAVGVDNITDATYITSNTYADLTLLAGGGTVMPLNEPGRYFYTQLKYKF